jgi:hypothetical protein
MLMPIPSNTLSKKLPLMAFQKAAPFPVKRSFKALRFIDLMEKISSS